MCQLRGRVTVGLLVVLLTCAGCHGTSTRRAAPEPAFSGPLEPNGTAVEATPPPEVSYVDRHPLLSKPRDYWETSGDNRIVKAAAATFVGVPVGLFGEMRQIVLGAPPQAR
jgi:hypothetical protein